MDSHQHHQRARWPILITPQSGLAAEMIVWGGVDDRSDVFKHRREDTIPAPNSWTATSTTNAPDARDSHTAVWTGSEMIVWGGTDDASNFNTGGRYCAQSGPTPTANAYVHAPLPYRHCDRNALLSTPTPTATQRYSDRSRPHTDWNAAA